MVTEALSLFFMLLVNLTSAGGDGTTKQRIEITCNNLRIENAAVLSTRELRLTLASHSFQYVVISIQPVYNRNLESYSYALIS